MEGVGYKGVRTGGVFGLHLSGESIQSVRFKEESVKTFIYATLYEICIKETPIKYVLQPCNEEVALFHNSYNFVHPYNVDGASFWPVLHIIKST